MRASVSVISARPSGWNGVDRGRMAALALLCAVLTGCATTSTTADRDTARFKPMPLADSTSSNLDMARLEDLRDLLHRARQAMEAANLAHEDGDNDKALEQYTLMLELLSEANLDPTVFYSLRTEFESILETSNEHARLHEPDPTSPWRRQATFLPPDSGLQYPTPLPERVLAEIEEILNVYPSNFERGLARASRYQPYIEQKFVEAGLPEDLVWLAMVESQFTPRIVSRAGAGGMWQFMRSTGRRYGLESDEYVDDRFDWKKSTDAAIGYLKELYAMFDGEWPLAVSAYNMGEGGLERAIAANGGDRDLWALIEEPPAADRIRLETKKFYPKLLASAIVGKNPEKYGFNPESQPPDDTTHLPVTGAFLLKDIENAAGIETGQLAALNPHLLREMTHPSRTVNLYVPTAHRSRVESALKELPKLRPDTHIVKRGETPSQIAALYGVSSDNLMQSNNIRSARNLQVGQRLVIPGRMGSGAATSQSAPQVASAPTPADAPRAVHRVHRGDSLSKIADRYNVSTRDLQSWNNLGSRTEIHVGDSLYVAAPSTARAPEGASAPAVSEFTAPKTEPVQIAAAPEAPAVKEFTHTVVRGETAGIIAQRYGVRLTDLRAWNNLNSKSVVYVGQKLKIITNGTPSATSGDPGASSAAEVFTHTVQRGENPTTIAQKYGINLQQLYAANNWTKAPTLHPGQKLTIKK